MSTAKTSLTVVFDGGNLASKLEVEKLKTKDKNNAMTLVDIAAGGRAEEYGCTIDAVKKTIHVRDADGTVFAGIEAISAMHDALGLGGYFPFCRTPGLTTGPSGFFPKKKAA